MKRVIDVYQQGSRLAWHDSLFEQVEPIRQPLPEPIPIGEATELPLPALTEADIAAPHCGDAMVGLVGTAAHAEGVGA